MIVEVLKEALLKNLGQLKQAPNNWLRRNCPVCHTQGHSRDTRSRFGIQFTNNSIAVNCFNCGFSCGYTEGKPLSKSLKHLLRTIGVDSKFIEYVEFESFKIKHKIQDRDPDAPSAIQRAKSSIETWHTIPLPDDALPIETWLRYNNSDYNFKRALEYVKSRSIRNLEQFYWSPSDAHNLKERVIIPYRYNDRSVGYTARLCYDTADKSIPKYYQQCPRDFVYNLDSQRDWNRKITIVTEGVLDAWTVDGVGVLGEITPNKIDIINRIGKQIIVSPDRDYKGGDLVRVAMENNWAVSFPKWDNGIKDAAKACEKYGRLLTVKSIIDSAITNPSKIKIKWDIEQNERKK